MNLRRFSYPLLLILFSSGLMAATETQTDWVAPTTLNTLLLIVVMLFLVVIGFLPRIFLTSLRLFQEHKNKGLLPVLAILAFLSAASPLKAQEALPAVTPASVPSPYNFETWI